MYGTLIEANAYFLARNNTEWASASDTAKNGALQSASDYIDVTYRLRFPGSKTGGVAQYPQWPRMNVAFDGVAYPDDEIPIQIKYATYEAALLIVNGTSLYMVPSSGNVKREKVKAGPVETETEYLDSSSASSTFVAIDNLLGEILVTSSGAEYELLRA